MKTVFMVLMILALFSGCAFGPSGELIPVENSSFESPDGESAALVETTDWVSGGTWYGRYKGEYAHDGQWVVWSSHRTGGPDNGYHQELDAVFAVGTYRLTVWAWGDAEGLVSRIILGYDSGGDVFVEIDHNDLGGLSPDQDWRRQTLSVEVAAGSPALGKSIWIRFTGTADPTSAGPADSNSWDDVSLLYYE